MDVVGLLQIILIILVFIVMILGAIYLVIILKSRTQKNEKEAGNKTAVATSTTSTFNGITRESIYKFLDFDEIVDSMIVRKNKTQYIMVIGCQGTNYDLLSEDEKIAVEEGFVQFLNTLRFPIQLYTQTSSLNLREILEQYKESVRNISDNVAKLKTKLQQAKAREDAELIQRLEFDIRRQENVLEYGLDITEYVGRMNMNSSILQQKTYIILSYHTAEINGVDKYNKDEIDDMCFSELYTRAQSIISSISSAGVTGKVLDSEEIAEMLYIAYNRDDSEIMQVSKAFNAQFDRLYSTGKDVLKKKQEQIERDLTDKAVDLVTDSIYKADEALKKQKEEESKKKVKVRALEVLEEYKDQMNEKLYEQTKKEILEEKEESKDSKPKKKETTKAKTTKRTAKEN